MSDVTLLAPRPSHAVATRDEHEWSVEAMVNQAKKIQECINAVMKRDEHYGVIPGTQGREGKPPKPVLLKPGAEKLCLMFRLDPEYDIMTEAHEATFISYKVRCSLFHIPTGSRIASGLGSCNSREDKYVRAASKKCPKCGKESIIKGKEEYGGGWLCFRKKGGCDAKWPDGAAEIEQQDTGVKDPADLDNTLLKMACKRALIAAVLNGTAASDCFTQDLEDLTEKAAEYQPPEPKQEKFTPPTGGAPGPKAHGSAPIAPSATVVIPSAPSAGPGPSSPATTAKAPRANTIKHDGKMASHKQVTLLHVLRSKVGVGNCDGGCAKETLKFSKTAGKLVPATVRCTYHTQLAGFKDQQDKPIETSTKLSEAQIASLIERYEAKLANHEAHPPEPIDIADINAPEPGKVSSEGVASIMVAMQGKDVDVRELLAIFNADQVSALSDEHAGMMLSLVLAHGTPSYERVLDDVRTHA